MKYKDLIKNCINEYAKDPCSRFIGYNTAKGSRMYGTLEDVPVEQCIETPVAENLMLGLGMGLSLEGFKPVVCFERHDFLLCGMDALVNHLDALPSLSGGQYRFPVIVRAIVGAEKPLNPGPQHTRDYATELHGMLRHTQVFTPIPDDRCVEDFKQAFSWVGKSTSGAVLIIEYRDAYEEELPTQWSENKDGTTGED